MKIRTENPDEFLSRAMIRPQPKRAFPKPDLDDIAGAALIAGLFFALFVLPWGM